METDPIAIVSKAINSLRANLIVELDVAGMALAGDEENLDLHNLVCEAEEVVGEAIDKLRLIRKEMIGLVQ